MQINNNVLAFSSAVTAGELIDASKLAADAGLGWPVGVHKAVFAAVSRIANGKTDDALWELLFAASIQAQELARKDPDASEVTVQAVVGIRRGMGAVVHAQMVVGVDEISKTPCIVFLKPAFLETSGQAA
jgi:hypothetical protein